MEMSFIDWLLVYKNLQLSEVIEIMDNIFDKTELHKKKIFEKLELVNGAKREYWG